MAFEMERNALVELLQGLVQQKPAPKDKAFANIEAAIEYSGTKIILPADPRQMKLSEAREWLTRLEQAEEQVVSIREVIDAHPWDGCVAFLRPCSRPMAGHSRCRREHSSAVIRRRWSPSRPGSARPPHLLGSFQLPGIEGHSSPAPRRSAVRCASSSKDNQAQAHGDDPCAGRADTADRARALDLSWPRHQAARSTAARST